MPAGIKVPGSPCCSQQSQEVSSGFLQGCQELSTEINTAFIFNKDRVYFIYSLTEDHGQQNNLREVLVNCSKAISFGDTLNTFSKAGHTCRKEFTSPIHQVVYHGYI